MNHGFMVTILQLNNNLHSGSVQTSHGRKSTSKSEPCQVNAGYFFRLWGCCALRICSKRSHDRQRILRWSSEKIAWCRDRKRPRFWSSGDWLLHHDNAPAHSSNLVQQFLAEHKVVQLRQPPYRPDIAHCDFWMFPKLKMALNGKRFDDTRWFGVMRRVSWRTFQNLHSTTALRCGSTAGSMWFNQMGITLKDSTVRMTKNFGYFSDTPRSMFSSLRFALKAGKIQFWPTVTRQQSKGIGFICRPNKKCIS